MCSLTDPFELEVVKLSPNLKRYAVNLCKDPVLAEDLVQDTVLRALKSRDTFVVGTNLVGWLTTLLKNNYHTSWRKLKREVEDVDGVIAEHVPIEAGQLRKLEANEILRFIDAMPDQYRIPLRLIADGASYEEAAAEMVEHVGTIKSRVNRGRAMLKAAGW